MPLQKFHYRPEIDGLRAVAVLSVFTFHLNRAWLPGGFVGVDIFFVISGYLITSILLQACATGRFSLAKFYQRRIARLFPAFFTVALSSLAIASAIYSPQDLASAGATLVAASLSLANMKFMLQGNYFELSPDAQPFLHYWSLSVEEQFYLFFPVTLYLIFRYARHRMEIILGLTGTASFLACALLTPVNPVWAFYLLPTRAWELFAGALVAARPLRITAYPDVSKKGWLSPVGLLLLAASFLAIHEGPEFPGAVAAVPVIGTVAVILPGATRNWTQKFLVSKVMVTIGRMSYSLYLWHWPVFCFVDYELYAMPAPVRLALKIFFPAFLAIVTFYAVEKPARTVLNTPSNRPLAYAFLAAMLALCVPLGLVIRNNNYINAELSDVRGGGLVFPGKEGAPTVVLMGDSNGSMYGKVMKEICAGLGYTLRVISVAAGDPFPSRGNTDQLWAGTLATVRETKPDYLVFAAAWAEKLKDDPGRLAAALGELKRYSKHILLLNQPPILPREASRAAIRNGAHPPFAEPAHSRDERRKVNELLLTLRSPTVSVIDIARYFEAANGEVMFAGEQGEQLYHDSGHLSGHGADRIRAALTQGLLNH
jgi:peptidoglycan/LPS O-acetylase OafA/YrhL